MANKETTKLTLTLVHETAEARLYEDGRKREQWIPRSVCPSTIKLNGGAVVRPVHLVSVEDWWLEQHPFEKLKPKMQDELL